MNGKIQIALAATVGLSTLLMADFALAKCPSGDVETNSRGHFVLNDDVVIDTTTKFSWARCSVGQRWSEESSACTGTPRKSTYDEAIGAARPAGWRLPTPDELKTLVLEGCENPSIDSRIFPGTAPDPYWAVDGEGCWIVNFGPGVIYGPNSYLCGYGNVSAVRLIHEE